MQIPKGKWRKIEYISLLLTVEGQNGTMEGDRGNYICELTKVGREKVVKGNYQIWNKNWNN